MKKTRRGKGITKEQMTITVPRSLLSRLRLSSIKMNWSAICTEALQKHIEREEKRELCLQREAELLDPDSPPYIKEMMIQITGLTPLVVDNYKKVRAAFGTRA
jgi:post-segregation antitoxin (ccd killing protein)